MSVAAFSFACDIVLGLFELKDVSFYSLSGGYTLLAGQLVRLSNRNLVIFNTIVL